MINRTAFTEDPTSLAILTIDGEEIRNLTSWVASQDCLMIGDPFSVVIPNPRGKYTKRLQVGAKVQLHLQNPAVNGGRPALTHTGLVVERESTGDSATGSVIRLQCADRGWHLQNNCPAFEVNGTPQLLEHTNLFNLIQRFAKNPSWGFADSSGKVEIRADDKTSRLLRLGVPPTRAQAQAAVANELIVYRAIVEPGQSVADIITSAAKRHNRLVGVGADGVLQVWNPDYTQRPLYRLDYHSSDDPDSVRNNVITARVIDRLDTKYTRVEVVGQVIGYFPQDPNDLAPGRFSQVATNPGVVPFDHELTYGDGEVWRSATATKAAQWKLNRSLYDSFEMTYKVRGHHQNGNWWAAGTMCELHDSVQGYTGDYFVSAIKHMRTRDGDQTEITLRLKGLLSASFDRLNKRSL